MKSGFFVSLILFYVNKTSNQFLFLLILCHNLREVYLLRMRENFSLNLLGENCENYQVDWNGKRDICEKLNEKPFWRAYWLKIIDKGGESYFKWKMVEKIEDKTSWIQKTEYPKSLPTYQLSLNFLRKVLISNNLKTTSTICRIRYIFPIISQKERKIK